MLSLYTHYSYLYRIGLGTGGACPESLRGEGRTMRASPSSGWAVYTYIGVCKSVHMSKYNVCYTICNITYIHTYIHMVYYTIHEYIQ